MSRQFGPYELVRQIAVGGMAEIHLAKTSGIAGFEKYVALKMIHPNFSQDQEKYQNFFLVEIALGRGSRGAVPVLAQTGCRIDMTWRGEKMV